MKTQDILTLVVGLAIMTIVIIGFFDLDLMVEIWVKVLIIVLFAGVIVGVVKQFVR